MTFEIVAHRGDAELYPENSLPAFERAIELGADAVELDARLTADHVPVVYHYFYLEEGTSGSGMIAEWNYKNIQELRLVSSPGTETNLFIPSLAETLQRLAGRIGIEIELKGPEPEAPAVLAAVLADFYSHWERIEVTSYEPALLLEIRRLCPGLAADLLQPRSEPWMGPDVVRFISQQRGRLCGARAVHLHPSQLSRATVSVLRRTGLEIHMWDANSNADFALAEELEIPRLTTDRLALALEFRARSVNVPR